MPAFSLSPLTGVPPPEQESFPNFMQLQAEGTDLGLPDADTINFSTGLAATRGTGENSNVVTVVATGTAASTLQVQEDGVDLGPPDVDTLNFASGVLATRGSDSTVTITVEGIQFQEDGVDLGPPDVTTLNFAQGIEATRGSDDTVTVTVSGGAGPSYGVIALTSDVEGDGAFDDTPFPSVWTVEELVPNAAWAFDGDTATLTFNAAGVYRVIATCSATAQIEGFAWPDGETHYGSTIDGVKSQFYRTKVVDTSHTPRWTDQVVIQVDEAPQDAIMRLYALAVDDTETPIGRCSMTLTIERLGDAPAP